MSSVVSLFNRLPDDERRALRAVTRRRRFSKGDTIFFEGDLGDSLHVIERGHVAIRVGSVRGDVTTLTVLMPGESFGEQALLDPDFRRTASAVCLDAVETLSFTKREFEDLRKRLPMVDRFLIEVLAQQVRRLSTVVMELVHVDAESRIIRRLVDLAEAYAEDDPVSIAITQDDIASMAGTTRPTANKALKAAEDAGHLELSRGRVIVHDRDALRKSVRY